MPKKLFSALRAPTPEQIKAARLASGLSQSEVARILGVPQPVFAIWESGRNSTKREDKIKLLWRLVEENPTE